MAGPITVDHVDVFTDSALAGNGLTVVRGAGGLPDHTLLAIAQELRQFETIFLTDVGPDGAEARIFTPEEELAFAGHPVLGAAAVLHRGLPSLGPRHQWQIRIGGRPVPVTTVLSPTGIVAAEMDQGPAEVWPPLPSELAHRFVAALGMLPEHLRTDLPTQVASTGLPYLLVPVTPPGLAVGRVASPDLESMLAGVGASFVYVLEPDRPEGRTWDLRGVTEDVATGSAAGPAADYLVRHGLRPDGEPFHVHQGQFVGRPSRIGVRRDASGSMHVSGDVAPFSVGTIHLP